MFALGWFSGCLVGTIVGSWWTSRFLKVGELVIIEAKQPTEQG